MKNHTEFPTFGAFLRHLRTKQKLTQSAVAQAVFGDKPKNKDKTISKLENDFQLFDPQLTSAFEKVLQCQEGALQNALNYFDARRPREVVVLDDQEDVLPILRKIVAVAKPITEKRLFETIGHYHELTKVGVHF